MTQMSGKSTGGVLQIPAAATQKNAPAKKAPKPPASRLKLLVRRLPPGLTEEEFKNATGDEWATGTGKVDWLQYKPGKVSKDPAKPSRPSRAYIHVVSSDYIAPLSDKIRQTSFLDALNTANDPVLLGPPSLEFAPYAKIPGNRVRKDARQGTIDQDPDFFAFLESLTQPITKLNPVESTEEDKKETATITPLVQYIKDKKANKAKELAAAKSSRHKSDKEAKPEKVQAKKLLQRPDKESSTTEKKSRADKATKEAVKAANKAAVAAKPAGKASTTPNAGKDAAPSAPASERKRGERGNAAAAAKILQRDLGLSGGRRKGGKGTTAEADAPKKEPAASPEPSKKDTARPPKAQAKGKGNENAPQPSDPSTSRTPLDTPPSTPNPVKPPKSSKGKQVAASATAATQAFLKHANPSQGVTEPLLESAFAPFGKVVKVEIDKKKGFGYVDFADTSGLQKAIAGSPVTVAQSQVVVLERKVNPGGEKSRGKGREQQQPSANGGSNGNNNTSRGGKASEGGGGSSRGPRGGRGKKGGKTGEKAAESK